MYLVAFLDEDIIVEKLAKEQDGSNPSGIHKMTQKERDV